jgi:hypothetical protein
MVKTKTTETTIDVPVSFVDESETNGHINRETGEVMGEQLLEEKDEFADTQYLDPHARLPKIQALRGITSQTCGYFVSQKQMAKAGWLNYEEKDLITYTFESSTEEQGLLFPNPRMLVCPRTPILAYDRKATKETEQLVIIGSWLKEYRNDENISNCQIFEVILLDKHNQPLHQVPLAYCAKGANQATFSVEWQKLVDEITSCHAITNRIAARGKDLRFKSLCVFSFQTKRELVGDKQKTSACRVVSHDVPTLDNWKDYFVGFNQEIKQLIWDSLQPNQPLIVPGQETQKLVPLLPETNVSQVNF